MFHVHISAQHIEAHYTHFSASRACWAIRAHEIKNGREAAVTMVDGSGAPCEPIPYQECALLSWVVDVLDAAGKDGAK